MTRLKLSVATEAAQRSLAMGELDLPRTVAGLVATALGGEVLFVGSQDAEAHGAFALGELQSLHASPDPQSVIAAFSRIEGFETTFPMTVSAAASLLAESDWNAAVGGAGRLTSIFPGVGSGFGENLQTRFEPTTTATDILAIYDMRCAVTGEHLVTPEGVRQLETVHLQPISRGGATNPTNTLLLHASVAWAVRQGYVTFGDDYEIIMRQTPPVSLPPINSTGHLLLPPSPSNWPSREALRFHREHVALKASSE